MNTRSDSRGKHLSTAAVLLLACLTAATAMLGCLNVNVDADGLAREYSRVLDRVMAERIAVDTARDEGYHVDDYELDSKQREEVWWVSFKAVTSPRRGEPAHFVVRVSNDGEAELLQDP